MQRIVVIEKPEKNLALVRERLNERDWRWGNGKHAARMGNPGDIYRLNQDQAVDAPWVSHSSCVLAISPSPIPFIQSLTDEGKIFFRLFDHHDALHDALFNLGKVSEVRSRLMEACNWDGATKATGNPAPPVSPSPPPTPPR